jgi:hypothetical protein
MKNLLKLDIKTITIIGLVLVVLFMKMCGTNNTNKTNETIKIDGKKYRVLKRDTLIEYKTNTTIITKPGKDIYHDTTIYVEVPTDKPIDTMSILKEFYAKNVYKDTIKLDDSLGFVFIRDTISQNKILKRTFTSKIIEKQTNETVYVDEPSKRQIYFGVNGGLTNTELVKTIGFSGLYKTKTDNIYQIGVGLLNGNTVKPFLHGGVYWKIKLKK